MVDKIGRLVLAKKFSTDKLGKIGSLYFKGGAGNIKAGAQRGAILKKTLIQLGGGKTKTQFDRKLKELGVMGSQMKKRNVILGLAYGDKKSGLTKEQVERNLQIRRQRDESGLTSKEYKTTFASNTVSTKSIGASEAQKEKGARGRIGLNAGPAGFAGGQPGQATPGINFKS